MAEADFLAKLRIASSTGFVSRHIAYDEKIARLMLEALYDDGATIARSMAAEAKLTCYEVTTTYCPKTFAVEAAKLDRNISLETFTGKDFTKTEIWGKYEDLRNNHPGRNVFAMVCDKHGDSIGDLVLHNNGLLVASNNGAGWYFGFVVKNEHYYIQPLKQFLRDLRSVYSTLEAQ